MAGALLFKRGEMVMRKREEAGLEIKGKVGTLARNELKSLPEVGKHISEAHQKHN